MKIGNKATPYLLLLPILLVSGVMLYYCLGTEISSNAISDKEFRR